MIKGILLSEVYPFFVYRPFTIIVYIFIIRIYIVEMKNPVFVVKKFLKLFIWTVEKNLGDSACHHTVKN